MAKFSFKAKNKADGENTNDVSVQSTTDANGTKNPSETKSVARIGISLLVALLAFVGLVSFEGYLLADKKTETVVMAKDNITKGTLIDENNVNNYFRLANVNVSLKTPQMYTNLNDVKGKAVANVESGELITTNNFVNTSIVDDTLKDPVEISFTAENLDKSVAGTIRAGDVCDIFGIEKTSANVLSHSKVLIKNAYIVATYDSQGAEIKSSDTTSLSTTFTIRVEKEDASAFNEQFATSVISVARVVDFDPTTDVQTNMLSSQIEADPITE